MRSPALPIARGRVVLRGARGGRTLELEFDANPRRCLGCSPAMTICATNLALRQLALEPLARAAACDKRGDVFRLPMLMIELEHERVPLAAMDTSRKRQILQK
jgi:hypothetical protein